jgi:hypothetical protein
MKKMRTKPPGLIEIDAAIMYETEYACHLKRSQS